MARFDPVKSRQRFVEAWNKTMIDIWRDRIEKLNVIDTGALWRSPVSLPVRADGRFYDIALSQTFLEYGLWQDFGTGREVPRGNTGNLGHSKVRQRRRWFSTKYYASVMKLRDFMGMSLGDDFKVLLVDALDPQKLRQNSGYNKH